jgi:hypothetical protein
MYLIDSIAITGRTVSRTTSTNRGNRCSIVRVISAADVSRSHSSRDAAIIAASSASWLSSFAAM